MHLLPFSDHPCFLPQFLSFFAASSINITMDGSGISWPTWSMKPEWRRSFCSIAFAVTHFWEK
jgi:hypothetical protein